MDLPVDDYGPRMNFVGFQTAATEVTSPYDWWMENIEPDQLEPPNIWEAMRERRLGPFSPVFSPIPYFGDAANYVPKTSGRWAVVEHDGDTRYRLRTPGEPDEGQGLGEYSLIAERTFSDFTMTLEAKTGESIASNTSADYAVIFGFQDEDNYCYLMANATAEYSQLFIVLDGVRSELATATTALLPDQDWHSLELSRNGDQITARLDGTEVLSTVNATWTSGSIGVGSYNDTVYFDNINVIDPTAVDGDADGDSDGDTDADGDGDTDGDGDGDI